ncbi:unnamed protein product, partial [Natator depressus]
MANSEISYAKGLEKLANKLTKALDKMKLKASVPATRRHAWAGRALLVRNLRSRTQEALAHQKWSTPGGTSQRTTITAQDNAVEKSAKLVVNNWSQQKK